MKKLIIVSLLLSIYQNSNCNTHRIYHEADQKFPFPIKVKMIMAGKSDEWCGLKIGPGQWDNCGTWGAHCVKEVQFFNANNGSYIGSATTGSWDALWCNMDCHIKNDGFHCADRGIG